MARQGQTVLKGLRFQQATAMSPVREDFLRLGAMSETALKNAMKALATRDEMLARRVAGDDEKIDELEAAIESRVLRLIALHGPMLQDLREAAFILKAITDIERIGDLSSKVARLVGELVQHPKVEEAGDVIRMGEIAASMLKDVLDAYVSGNEEKAHQACQRDEEIDAMNKSLQRELLVFMEANPRRVEQVYKLITISTSLERTADHITNLGERTVYVLTGKKPRY